MKKTILYLIVGLFYSLTFGQSEEVYLNDDLINISKSEFYKKTEQSKNYNLRFDLDTLIVNVKVLRVKKGNISKIKLDSIRNELSNLSNQKIESNNLLVINYYHGLDRCNSGGNKSYMVEKYKQYLKRLKKIENVNQFFMFKSSEGTKEYREQLKWIQDKSTIIERTFLPLDYPCGSFILIDEHGNYYTRKGEYNIYDIIGLIKKRKKTFANTI